MIKSGFARLLLTCTMPNKAPALIRPIIMKYAERKNNNNLNKKRKNHRNRFICSNRFVN